MVSGTQLSGIAIVAGLLAFRDAIDRRYGRYGELMGDLLWKLVDGELQLVKFDRDAERSACRHQARAGERRPCERNGDARHLRT